MSVGIRVICFINIIKSEVWTVCHCLGLSNETMVCTVCLSMFLYDFTLVVDTSWAVFTNHPSCHDDVIKSKRFARYWPFVSGIHRSPVNSPHKGQWRGTLMLSLICAWINTWVNNREAGDLRRYSAHYDVIVMWYRIITLSARQNRHFADDILKCIFVNEKFWIQNKISMRCVLR